jgi:hypothetical protein
MQLRRLRGDRHAAIALLRRAVELGVNHVDTAQFYGDGLVNELIGEAIGPDDGVTVVSKVGADPDLGGPYPIRMADGWALVERLLNDLAPLKEQLWLVIDDVHELDADQALRQLELLLLRAPPELRFVLATRHDVRLGLHRLRLEGELAEIRAGDLRFSLAEAGELFAAAGVELPGPTVALLHERTEGWAAGLRLAALAAAGHPDPDAPRCAGPGRRAAPGRRRVAGRARVPGGGGPARPGSAGLAPGRAAAGRPLAWPFPGRADRRRPRARGRVPGRPDRGRCRARGGGRG